MKRFIYILFGLAGYGLVRWFGLLGVATVLILEVLLLALWREGKQRGGIILLCSTLGIGAGYGFYPVSAFPSSVGVASLILALVVHAGIFLIIYGFLKTK